MANEEQTQIFRGDDAPPEMGIAETGGPRVSRKPDGPTLDRGLHDQKNGPSTARNIHDAQDELAELRQLHDARGDAADSLAHGKDEGPNDPRHLKDGDGPSDQHHLSDSDGITDARRMDDGDGLSDARHLSDADGPSLQRHSEDGDGPSLQRHSEDGDGPSDTRQLHDHHAVVPPGGGIGTVTLNSFGDVVDDELDEEAPAAAAVIEETPPAPMNDPDLTFEAEDDATPWALAIHLEARIASLSESTLKVNEQLNGLDESIKRLAKRIGK